MSDNLLLGNFTVKATPMTLGEYNRYRGWELPSNESADTLGFLLERVNYATGGVLHTTWEPVEVVEQSYTTLTATHDFSDALHLLKCGARVARKGWNGVGMHVRWEDGTRLADGTLVEGHFVIVSGLGVVNTWVPSVSDLQATDWYVIE